MAFLFRLSLGALLEAQASPPPVCDEGSPELKEAVLLDLLLLNWMQIGILSRQKGKIHGRRDLYSYRVN